MRNKSAKDIAFEKEKTKLQKQKRDVERQLMDRNDTIKILLNRIHELENIIVQKDEYIEQLLKYTELTKKEDLKAVIEKNKEISESLKTFKTLFGLCKGFY